MENFELSQINGETKCPHCGKKLIETIRIFHNLQVGHKFKNDKIVTIDDNPLCYGNILVGSMSAFCLSCETSINVSLEKGSGQLFDQYD